MTTTSQILPPGSRETGFFPRVWLWARRFLFPDYLFNRQVQTTRSGRIFLALIAAMAFAAFNTGNNLLFLVLSMMLASLLFSFLFSEAVIAKVWVTRHLPTIVTEGVNFRVTYVVQNQKKRIPSLALRISEKLGEMEVTTVAHYLPAKTEATVKAVARADCRGRVKFQDLRLSTAAPFGWFRKTKRVPLVGEVIALPQAHPEEVSWQDLPAPGPERPQNRRGRGDELFGFRGYVAGDPVKEIHWKTSARTGQLMVREREKEEERKLRLELMLSRERPPKTDSHREEIIRRAASLATVAINDNWQIRIEVQGRGVDFGSGPGHLRDLLYFLALFDDPQSAVGMNLPPSEEPALQLS